MGVEVTAVLADGIANGVTVPPPLLWVIVVAMLLMALAGIGASLRWLWLNVITRSVRTGITLADLYRLLAGDPQAHPPLLGMAHRVTALERNDADQARRLAALHQLAQELVPNGGGSWRDESRREADYQRDVNGLLASALGVSLPDPPARRDPKRVPGQRGPAD
jgi:hypothetical protein